jgi:histidine triad (HIT) family protein
MDLEGYEAQARACSGSCFVCAFVSGDPEFRHETVDQDDE